MLKVLAAIQFRSRGEWRNLPYFAISPAFHNRKVQRDNVRIESEKSGKCHSIIVHSYRLHTFNHCFACGYGFNPTKKGKKTMERDLNSVRHVFVGFVEGRESRIRNAEFATLSMSPVGAYSIILYFLY